MTKLVTVDFHDDTLFAVETPEGVFVAVTPICQRLGIDPQKQRQRILADPILSEGVSLTVYPSAGGDQEATGLRLDLLHGWLFTINDRRIPDPNIRARVLTYKRECYRALHARFYGQRTERHGHNDHTFVRPPGRDEPMRLRRQIVADALKIFGIRAAGSLWFELGMPTVPEMQKQPRQTEFGFTYTAVRQDPPAQPHGGK